MTKYLRILLAGLLTASLLLVSGTMLTASMEKDPLAKTLPRRPDVPHAIKHLDGPHEYFSCIVFCYQFYSGAPTIYYLCLRECSYYYYSPAVK